MCASCASTGLCGGRRATVVPTATAYSQAVGRADFFLGLSEEDAKAILAKEPAKKQDGQPSKFRLEIDPE